MPKDGNKGSGSRRKSVRVKTAKGRKTSSTAWLKRQLNDPLVAQAKNLGLRSRASFKLIELDKKFNLFKSGQTIIDLGAAPGSWCQVAQQKIGKKGTLVGVDLLEIEPIDGIHLIQGDFLDDYIQDMIVKATVGKADLVMSDMAANTTGHKQTDHIRTNILCEAAFDFAVTNLKEGGTFLTKTFQGGAGNEVLTKIKRNFRSIKHVKPKASRQESPEVYLVATDFKV